MKITRTQITVLGGVLAAALAAPASSLGAATIGSNLNGNTDDDLPGYCNAAPLGCTATNLSLPAGSAAAGGVTSPINGVVTSWKVKSNDGTGTQSLSMRVLRPAGGASYTGAGTSAPIAPSVGINTASTQLRINAGDSIGLNNSQSKLVFANTPGANTLAWGNPNGFANGLNDGATGTGQAFGNKETLVQANVEPDADNDGLGDETQDPCPTEPGPVCKTPNPNDKTAPKITGAKAKPKKFAVNRKGQSAAKKKATPKGTMFSYKLSEPATVMFTVERKRTKRKHGKKRTVYKRSGRFTIAGATGKNANAFSGLIKKKALKPGSYRAVLSAVDGSKNKSKDARAKFTVVK